MKKFSAVILDMDGTLLDSNEAHAQTWWRAAIDSGFRVELERVRSLIGMGSDHLVPALCGISAESETGKRMGEEKDRLFKQDYLPFLKPFPRARDLVEALAKRGANLAIASSSEGEDLKKFLRIVGIQNLIDSRISADDAEKSKPDPDLIRAALKRLGTSPGETLMIGDTPYDIEAASRAGIATIALRSGGRSDEDLAGSLAIYDDPAALLGALDRFPIGETHDPERKLDRRNPASLP